MQIILHKKFIKNFTKLRYEEKQKFKERRNLFQNNPFDPILKNHAVDAVYPGWRSINVTGDIRALYEEINEGVVVFMKIGTHSQLYK
jgi:mRNA-degrading endonuclease YafQ of YafQ-DinJ toxin-antitoxin module